jgi:hypothetical protein
MARSDLYDRTGETKVNNLGSKMTILKYINNRQIIIAFDNGYVTETQYIHFKNGQVKSPYCKSVCRIGYVGEGIYNKSENRKNTKVYDCWSNMIKRCYYTKTQIKHPTYIGCTVCDEWLNFQVFAKWWYENYYEIEGERTEIDKDILVKGNKIYSPNTCCIVPHDINKLFTKSDSIRGDYPVGVCYDKYENKYISLLNKIHNGKNIQVKLGRYNTIKEAFEKYKEEKEKFIKQKAEEYKEIIPLKLYNAMINWVVEIDD